MKKNLSGLNQLNNNLERHTSFGLYDNDGLFAKFIYDYDLKRYQSDYGYLTSQDVYQIMKDDDDERYVIWEENDGDNIK